MTIRELIELLAEHPPEAIVRLANDTHSIVTTVTRGECYECSRPEVTIR